MSSLPPALPSEPPPLPPPPPVQRTENKNEFLSAFVFPFRQRDCLAKLWWVPLVCLVPFLGLLAIKRWRLDIVRRRMAGRADLLPELADFGRFLADGWWLLVIRLVF